MHRRLLRRVERLHQVDFAARRAAAERADVLIDVLPLRAVLTDNFEPQQVDPEAREARFVRGTERDLLKTQDAKRPCVQGAAPLFHREAVKQAVAARAPNSILCAAARRVR